ncbi:hypothetical protein EHQ92_15675 [Leptospira biflexa]|jgi:hypothetical protein|uniref:Uncharacterized protein n=2 Tax=Leptospira biflexa TaxID=172 RepID=B0STQ3_LEPBP|nr:hypothetical protein [Leptospira biflexa]ABZ95873.1 Hypothetical protein LBF_4048 [Leptospira biflexa serovar Patoc strain 'Patoc 1 (Ames)']ABZ99587.1 Hypothetical protein; putative signal peptide [Leptospira biflexa serovar Patoc strain 'Patoc 1 (Paris)']TGM32020.1 hypothetical protein EHQ80_17125 [Leptospira biflexa]TGM39011.1 hypothetical protein EHQ89_07150 [Leptospira biflexa]TGM42768.1 hypothetical protein EHQ92_15675 [Leptospira biflexa]
MEKGRRFMFCMKKIPFLCFTLILCSFPFFLFGNEKVNSKAQCQQKEETVRTIFQLLPESERSCVEIAKLVIVEEDEEGEKLDKEYNELFLKVCELKRKKRSLDEIRENLGLSKQCNSLQDLTKKN